MAQIGKDIVKAATILNEGGLVAIPTETVYGLAGNAKDEDAILSIYDVKKRPRFDPLIAHVDTLAKVEELVKAVPEQAMKLGEKFWPGPLTILLPKVSNISDILTSGLSQIAVRVPDHSLTLSLLRELDYPLAAPSANPFGYVSPTSAEHVNNQLGDVIPYILNGGESKVGLESTIIGFEEDFMPVIYRLGGTKVEDIEKVVGRVKININISSDPKAPGMLKSHYSPGKKLVIGDISKNLNRYKGMNVGIISFKDLYEGYENFKFTLSESGDLDEAAKNIFKALREMDRPEINIILSEFLPDKGLGKAINDRLKRAAV